MKRRELLALSAVAGAAIAGCLGGGDSSNPDDPTVSVSGMGYEPRNLSVDVGTTVTWVNENETILPEHTVTSSKLFDEAADWEFDERLEEKGDEASHTFERDGLFTYVGTIKGEDCMCGVVAVGDASYDDPLPCDPVAGGGC